MSGWDLTAYGIYSSPRIVLAHSILHTRGVAGSTLEWVDHDIREHLANVRRSVECMYRKLVGVVDIRRKTALDRYARKKGFRRVLLRSGKSIRYLNRR